MCDGDRSRKSVSLYDISDRFCSKGVMAVHICLDTLICWTWCGVHASPPSLPMGVLVPRIRIAPFKAVKRSVLDRRRDPLPSPDVLDLPIQKITDAAFKTFHTVKVVPRVPLFCFFVFFRGGVSFFLPFGTHYKS